MQLPRSRDEFFAAVEQRMERIAQRTESINRRKEVIKYALDERRTRGRPAVAKTVDELNHAVIQALVFDLSAFEVSEFFMNLYGIQPSPHRAASVAFLTLLASELNVVHFGSQLARAEAMGKILAEEAFFNRSTEHLSREVFEKSRQAIEFMYEHITRNLAEGSQGR